MKRTIFQASYWGFAIFACSEASATNWYVDVNCSPPTDGTSGDPDCTIQAGINRAVNGDTVLVRAGTYATDATIDFNGKAITVKRETDTILPVITTTGTGAVVKVDFHNGETSTSILDGFEITGGAGTGRGIHCRLNSSPTIKNCTITGNRPATIEGGGGILLEDSNAQVIDCEITSNQATNGVGGGINILKNTASTPPTPQITGCLIEGNTAYRDGGGIGIKNSFPVITNCVISGNTANGGHGGGGVYSSPPEASGEGGTSGGPTCADGCSAGGAVKLTNCLVVGNSAPNAFGRGGGLFWGFNDIDGRTEISNCTISGNTATGDGDGIYAVVKCFTLRNSILWDNGPGGLGSEITLENARAFLRYDDIEGGLNNIKLIGANALRCEETNCGTSQILNSDPNFCDTPTDYSLCRVSPCIDAGDNAAVPAGITVDLDDAPRFVNDLCTTDTGCGTVPIVDMGAYEFQGGGDDCNLNGIPDECDEGGPFFPSQVAGCSIEHGRSLWRSEKNYLKLTFSCDITDPVADTQFKINKMLSGGQFDMVELANAFAIDVLLDSNNRPRILTIKAEPEPALQHQTWYGIRGTASWTNVVPFTLHYVNMIGDADNIKFVTATDISMINSNQGPQPEDSRFDINGDLFTTATDVSLANSHFGPPPAKPSGHATCAVCCPP